MNFYWTLVARILVLVSNKLQWSIWTVKKLSRNSECSKVLPQKLFFVSSKRMNELCMGFIMNAVLLNNLDFAAFGGKGRGASFSDPKKRCGRNSIKLRGADCDQFLQKCILSLRWYTKNQWQALNGILVNLHRGILKHLKWQTYTNMFERVYINWAEFSVPAGPPAGFVDQTSRCGTAICSVECVPRPTVQHIFISVPLRLLGIMGHENHH